MQAMQRLRDQAFGSVVLPPGRFFTPRPVFWDILKAFVDGERGLGRTLTFMDCGAGSGDLIQEAAQREIQLVGCDVMRRDGQSSAVMNIDATSIRWNEQYWPIICRPDHSGWAADVVSNAILQGARAIYISKPYNYHQDVGGLPIKRFARHVGEAGETMYITG